MHYSLLPESSPSFSRHRSMQLLLKQQPLYHFSLKQVISLQQYYDQVKYQQKLVTKFIILGLVKQVQKAQSPRGMPILKIKIDDGTVDWKQIKAIVIYYDIKTEQNLTYAMKNQLYIELGCQPKITGLVYKTQIQNTALSVKIIQDFNQLTAHWLECMKTNLITV